VKCHFSFLVFLNRQGFLDSWLILPVLAFVNKWRDIFFVVAASLTWIGMP
jgi:hypothetical protein